MAQIMGKAMRFVIHVPLATGRSLVRAAKEVGMNEAAFTSAALVIGGRSLLKSDELMKNLTPEQAAEFAKAVMALAPGAVGPLQITAKKVRAKKSG